MQLPIKDKNEIIVFFSSDVMRERTPITQSGYKEGYLTKRGKNFGGWKTRYFVLQGPVLEYYESVRRKKLCMTFYFADVSSIARWRTSRIYPNNWCADWPTAKTWRETRRRRRERIQTCIPDRGSLEERSWWRSNSARALRRERQRKGCLGRSACEIYQRPIL